MKPLSSSAVRRRRTPAAFTVKVAARLAGVSENQVRLWERRFGLLEPVRAENGYRLYTRDDVAVLAHLGRETARGIPIRVLAQKGRRHLLAEAAALPLPAGDPPGRADAPPRRARSVSAPARSPRSRLQLAPELLDAITRGRASTFEAHLDALEAGMPFPDAVLSIELPILARIGELAMSGELPIAAEHVATDVVRRRIIAFVHGLEMTRAASPLLLAGAPGDHHEVGLLAAMLHLALRRLPFVYLGANLPLGDLEKAAVRMGARGVLVAAAAPLPEDDALALASSLKRLASRGVPVGMGGYEALRRERLFRECDVALLRSIDEATGWAALQAPAAGIGTSR